MRIKPVAEYHRVRVVSLDDYIAWRTQVDGPLPGEVLMAFTGSPPDAFHWTCPGCGRAYHGRCATEPAPKGKDPVWVLSGNLSSPSLHPPLRCKASRQNAPGWHDWWLLGGSLVPA
jgi:hypothetical protein